MMKTSQPFMMALHWGIRSAEGRFCRRMRVPMAAEMLKAQYTIVVCAATITVKADCAQLSLKLNQRLLGG
jgi:hypothetical protein